MNENEKEEYVDRCLKLESIIRMELANEEIPRVRAAVLSTLLTDEIMHQDRWEYCLKQVISIIENRCIEESKKPDIKK
jgi:hypothetical protein